MLSGQVTIGDLCKVTGYTRHQVHGLVKMALSDRPTKGERFAREFRSHDLILVAAIAELETKFGISRSRVAVVAKRLSQVLAGPREPNPVARLIVTFDPPKVTYAEVPVPVLDGVVMPLGPVFDRVDSYVTIASTTSKQQQLRLGPAVLRAAARRGSS